MEAVQEKSLTLEDKAKLKQRLALLKKEYKRTVTRLQKSERAERVKIHVKGPIEEQSQEYIGQDRVLLSAGLENVTSNALDLGELHRKYETPSADKLCVSSLEPEIVNSNSRTPPCSGGESSEQEAEGNRAHQSSQVSRNRLRLSRPARKVCFSESPSPGVFRVSSTVNVLDGKESTLDKSLSPVFNKHPTDHAPLRPDNATASFWSEDTKPEDIAHEIVGPSNTALFRLGTADNSPGEVRRNFDTLQSVGAEITTPNELVQHCVEKTETTEEQPLPTDVAATRNSNCALLVTPLQVLVFENRTDLKTTSEPSPPLSSQNQTPPNLKMQAESTVIEEGHNPLSSCTLVEGLLFPVEYYVRTTRRMASCQRKIDIDAVINSHLITGRKGSRGRPRRNSTSSSTPINTSDKLFNSLTPLSRPSVNSAGVVSRSRRGRGRKSCPAVLSSGLKDISIQLKFGDESSLTPSGSQSEKENCEEASPSKSQSAAKCLTNITDGSQIKEMDGFRILLSDKKAYNLRSQDSAVLNVRTSASDFGSSKEANEPTGSPFPRFSGKVSLDNLSHLLKITDFHLPDEDFGILKLDKLKSANHLEPFTPHTSRERGECSQHPKNDSSTLPPTGSSAVLQEVDLRSCSQKSEIALKLLETNEHCTDVDHPPCNNGSILGNDIQQSADAVVSPHSPIREPTNALLSQMSPVITEVLDSKEKTSHSPTKDFLCSPSPNENHSRTISILGRLLPDDEISPTILLNPTGSLNDGEVQACIPFTEVSGAAECLGANLDSCKGLESNDVPTDSPTESEMPGKLSSPKELNSTALFLPSVCSVPLESIIDTVASFCTPGLPFLGSTPAVFSSPQGSKTFVVCSPVDEGQEKALCSEACGGEGPTYMPLSYLIATGDTEDTKPCHVVLGQDNNTVVEGHCENLEHQEKSLLSKTDKDRSVLVTSGRAANEDTEEGIVSGGQLRLLSEVKESCGGGGCAVDLCSVWWEFSDRPELCIVSASESSVCLWRPKSEVAWECAHMWSFTEMPVIEILPLSQEKNIVCVALGNLEIMEIWALFSSPERLGWEKQLVKRGHMKTAQGLSRHRLVSSGIGEDGQVVEVQQLSETGSSVDSLSLVPPRDSVLAFCEVEGEKNALVGSTMDAYVVVWNTITGHLLSSVCMGDHCSDLTCLSVTSDSGLLFLVVGSLFSKPCVDAGSCIFKLIAVNPLGGASTPIMSYVIPNKPGSRYLEADVKRQKAAAVLTCGSIALWDLPRSRCSVTLPPSLDAPWCLVRWSHSPSCLLIGKIDGTICIYEYTEPYSNKES
ncbi:PREDICTED: partner and localizer of BRCA2 [Nanorana parkeri]|uniref:partner and localizer of BRCA2 n=1 Tax=Nanorana parkeri TaxID=125878 RepID=UPI000854E5C5|nr:PREDICTED: partner and localizer of BRCA2 [Nanorana parkeri]